MYASRLKTFIERVEEHQRNYVSDKESLMSTTFVEDHEIENTLNYTYIQCD